MLVFGSDQNVTVKHSGSYPGLTFCQLWMLFDCRFGLLIQCDISPCYAEEAEAALALRRQDKQGSKQRATVAARAAYIDNKFGSILVTINVTRAANANITALRCRIQSSNGHTISSRRCNISCKLLLRLW